MVRYAVLGSGSKGNAYIIENDSFAVMVDQGYSLKELLTRLKDADFNINKVKFVFLTHSHADHNKGVVELAQAYSIPVIIHKNVQLKGATSVIRWDILPNRHYTYESLSFQSFATSHDSAYSQSYSIELSGFRFTFITDTGIILPPMKNFAEASHLLFLESNYCHEMLMTGDYSDYLKKRISGRRGHLSNDDCAHFLKQLNSTTLRKIFLCHLSEKNNSIDAINKAIRSIHNPLPSITICPRDSLMPSESLSHNYSTDDYRADTFFRKKNSPVASRPLP